MSRTGVALSRASTSFFACLTWMAGTSPGMTKNMVSYIRSNNCRIKVVIRPVGDTISFMMVK